MAKKPVMLMILDGWGIAPAGPYNAATTASTPHLDSYFADYPNTKLEASGEDVGLPRGRCRAAGWSDWEFGSRASEHRVGPDHLSGPVPDFPCYQRRQFL